MALKQRALVQSMNGGLLGLMVEKKLLLVSLQVGINDKHVITTAMTVYIHLIEVCRWFDVEMHPSSELEKIFVSGCKRKQSTVKEVFLPIPYSIAFTPQSIIDVTESSFFFSLSDNLNLNFAIVGSDSNIQIYKISNGLIPPKMAKRCSSHCFW